MFIETKDLVIKIGKIEEAELMHKNFFSEEETAKLMLWSPTKNVQVAEEKLYIL